MQAERTGYSSFYPPPHSFSEPCLSSGPGAVHLPPMLWLTLILFPLLLRCTSTTCRAFSSCNFFPISRALSHAANPPSHAPRIAVSLYARVLCFHSSQLLVRVLTRACKSARDAANDTHRRRTSPPYATFLVWPPLDKSYVPTLVFQPAFTCSVISPSPKLCSLKIQSPFAPVIFLG